MCVDIVHLVTCIDSMQSKVCTAPFHLHPLAVSPWSCCRSIDLLIYRVINTQLLQHAFQTTIPASWLSLSAYPHRKPLINLHLRHADSTTHRSTGGVSASRTLWGARTHRSTTAAALGRVRLRVCSKQSMPYCARRHTVDPRCRPVTPLRRGLKVLFGLWRSRRWACARS